MAVALIAGVIGSQGPEFAEQYRQRMGGALDELKRIVAQFDAAAAHRGLTTPQGLGRLEQNADPLARKQGEDMVETIARADRLEGEPEAMRSAGPLRRIYVMGERLRPGSRPRHSRKLRACGPAIVGSYYGGRIGRNLGLGCDASCRLADPSSTPAFGPSGD